MGSVSGNVLTDLHFAGVFRRYLVERRHIYIYIYIYQCIKTGHAKSKFAWRTHSAIWYTFIISLMYNRTYGKEFTSVFSCVYICNTYITYNYLGHYNHFYFWNSYFDTNWFRLPCVTWRHICFSRIISVNARAPDGSKPSVKPIMTCID